MRIELDGIWYRYDDDRWALEDVSTTVESGEILAIIGHTGSGKSTLIQHLNGLYQPERGTVTIDGTPAWTKRGKWRDPSLRLKTGMLFQYPEHQLFGETVFEDVAFGPRNQGLDAEQVASRVNKALDAVGLDEAVRDRSPFLLSGGEMRRVALAGVIAMEPDVLVLDEPTAGLDPQGSQQVMQLILDWHQQTGAGVVLVTHQMDQVARYAQRVLVMSGGSIVLEGSPAEVFNHEDELEALGLGLPRARQVLQLLARRGLTVKSSALTLEQVRFDVRQQLLARKREVSDHDERQ